MSAGTNPLGFLVPPDPRQVELVLNLDMKTKQGKIRWIREGSAISASVPSGLKLNFVLSANIFAAAASEWQLFTVRDSKGSELLRVTNSSSFILSTTRSNALTGATESLYRSAIATIRDDLDNAIDSVKNL